jgi:hypothetical protein
MEKENQTRTLDERIIQFANKVDDQGLFTMEKMLSDPDFKDWKYDHKFVLDQLIEFSQSGNLIPYGVIEKQSPFFVANESPNFYKLRRLNNLPAISPSDEEINLYAKHRVTPIKIYGLQEGLIDLNSIESSPETNCLPIKSAWGEKIYLKPKPTRGLKIIISSEKKRGTVDVSQVRYLYFKADPLFPKEGEGERLVAGVHIKAAYKEGLKQNSE